MNAETIDSASPRFRGTLRLLTWGVTLVLVIVLIRVVQLQTMPSEKLAVHIQDRISHREEIGRRGDILDRRGRLVAATRIGWRLFVDPSVLQAPYGETIETIAGVTGLDSDVVAQRLLPRIEQSNERRRHGRTPIRYVSIGGILSDDHAERAKRLSIRGVHLERRSVRESMVDADMASLVGLVGVEHRGLLGAELAFQRSLAPQPGRLDYVRDAQGRAMWVEVSGYVPASSGENVRLSIDLVLQQIARQEIERGVERADAAGGRLVMADPRTGEILAMVSVERRFAGLVEPPAPGAGAPSALPTARYRTITDSGGRGDDPALARNRCIEEVYEPGSTFKPFVWGLITQEGLARPDEEFETHEGVWRTSFGRVIRDVIRRDTMTWSEVLRNSSNIGMVQGVMRLSHDALHEGVRRFGFGAVTGIGLPGEAPGIVTSRRNWSNYTQSSVASGYEVAVTPLQMVRAFSALARTRHGAGTLPALRIRAASTPVDGSGYQERVLDQEIASRVRAELVAVARHMEEQLLAAFPDEPDLEYSLFGKSGTAEIPRPDGRGYFDDQYISSFIAGAPVEDPSLVVLVIIDDPGPHTIAARRHYGSWVAGPVVRRVVQRSLEYLGASKSRAARPESRAKGDGGARDSD